MCTFAARGSFGAAPEESVVFEDSAYAIRTAKAAGFPWWRWRTPFPQNGEGRMKPGRALPGF